MEERDLSAEFHRAYDPVIPPAPWLMASVTHAISQRRATGVRVRPSGLSVAWVVSILAAVLIAALVIVALFEHFGPKALVPGGRGSTACDGGLDFLPPDATNAPGDASPLPAAVPSGFGFECGVYTASSDSPASLAKHYQSLLTDAGWSVNTNGPNAGFVVTRWVPDPKVTGGPQPGYKPEFTGLTGDDVSSAHSVLDSIGISWVVNVRLTPRGSALFADLTRANVAACPGDASTVQTAICPERFLAFWIGLTQNDIDHWEDSAYANGVSQPFDSAGGPQNTYPDLISDPLTLEAIAGGQFQIATSSRESADYIAEGFNTHLFGSHVQLTFTKGHAYGVIDLVPQPHGTAIWVRVVS